MKTNVGTVDRILRALMALIFILAYLKGWLRGTAGLLLVIGGMLLSSSLSGYCPLYSTLNINTH